MAKLGRRGARPEPRAAGAEPGRGRTACLAAGGRTPLRLAALASRSAGERGSGTVLAIGLVGALGAAMVAVSLVAASTSAQHQAQAAADLAALAGAQALIDGLGTDQACAAATRVAAAMEADLTQCAPLGASDLRAQADIWVNLGMLGARAARASAVAGLP